MPSKSLFRVLGVLPVVVALAGCSTVANDWDSAMTGIGLYEPDHAQAPAPKLRTETAAVAQKSPDEIWCEQVATENRNAAARDGFDLATQQNRYATSFRQCMALSDEGKAE